MAKKASVSSNRGGRKPLWDVLNMDKKLDSVQGWALQGSTDEEMCQMLGISHDTFYKWKRERTEFAEALLKGKHIANGELINQAFKEARGYTYTEEVATPSGEVLKVERFARANPTMLQFMIKNRMPDEYKDRQQHEVSGPNGKPIRIGRAPDLSVFSEEELVQLEAFVDKLTDRTSE